ncbi:MAG: hypothetical protein Q3960_02710 [Lactobacillus sp.]|nr:hypothetical protein [Lactobacillus sp.]
MKLASFGFGLGLILGYKYHQEIKNSYQKLNKVNQNYQNVLDQLPKAQKSMKELNRRIARFEQTIQNI